MRKMTRVLLAVALLAGCVDRGPEGECERDDECEGDLSCLTISTVGQSGCEEFSTVCSRTCTSDAECRALGEGDVEYRCIEQCDGLSLCGQI